MGFRLWLAALVATATAGATQAADLTIQLRDAAGRPVADAVVTLYPKAGTPPPSQTGVAWPMRMEQKNRMFSPFVLIVPVGATVAFPNFDSVRHHVYSFSPAHPFELKLYGHDETRSVRFDKPGPVALGCDIHDQMIAFIRVVDTPLAAKSDANGLARFSGAPVGDATMRIWHPYLKAPANEVALPVAVKSAGERRTVTIDVRAPPPIGADY